METVSIESALSKIHNYLINSLTTPLFIVVEDSDQYSEIMTEFCTLAHIYVSSYCANADSHPDFDLLFSNLSYITQNSLLLGLGESVYLGGLERSIARIADLELSAKLVIICRGIRSPLKTLCAENKKFNGRRVCFLNAGLSLEVIRIPRTLVEAFPLPNGMIIAIGFKDLLHRIENNTNDKIFVITELVLYGVRNAASPYDILREINPAFPFLQSYLTDNLWSDYLYDNKLDGYSPFHWRSFLKFKNVSVSNSYLKYVLEISDDYVTYSKQIVFALLDIGISDKRFPVFYAERKALLKSLRDSDIAEYVAETKIKDNDRIYFLTDNTVTERQAIIECLDKASSIPEQIEYVYPALYDYLHDFSFIGEIGSLLTEYFSEYKRLKLTNRITTEFLGLVRKLAVDGNRPYNGLVTRGEIFDSIKKLNTALYWIDSLGVEYLGYIQNRASKLGLKITIHIARANLPTITSYNSDFYSNWSGIKEKTKALDKIKHEGDQDYNYQVKKIPIHLVEELQIIDAALEWAKSKLKGREIAKVIIASDHGASRLAVINDQECKWEMTSSGEHSGRCCLCSEADVESEYATKENDFWVLANYDRFKGGRKASVEVHGGATLEEVVVPLIEIELYDNKIEISNLTPLIYVSYKKTAEMILFSKNSLSMLSIKVCGKLYYAKAISPNKHKVILADISSAGKYRADVFEGDNLIGQVEFEIQRAIVKQNDSDWFQ